MYRNKVARAAVMTLVVAMAVVAACSKFVGEPPSVAGDSGAREGGEVSPREEGGDAGGEGAVDGGADADADAADAAIIVGETMPVASVSCGGSACPLGDGCCLGAAGPVCTTRAACTTGFFLACVTSATCGSASVCCFDGARSACATACGGGGGICQVGSECTSGVCGPVKCAVEAGVPIVPFNLCSDSKVIPTTRDGLACTR